MEPSFGLHILEQMLRVNLCEAMRGICVAFFFPRWSWGQLGVGPARRCETLVPHGAARIQV